VPITAIADLRFSREGLDEGLKALASMLPATRAFAGCIAVDVAQDQADPTHVLLIEAWESADDHRAYMAWRASSGTNTGLRGVLAAPPVITYLDQRTDI
jgi:heme oxygenase (mycobilin-producing)